MLNNGNKGCEFNDEIVSYIYDEMDPAGRSRFESHLASCTACTDEFAGISNARFSVFEWHKEEFAPLATPEIVIPYAPKASANKAEATSGFFAGLQELLAFARSPLAIGGAFAAVLVIGFLAFNFMDRRSEQTIASNAAENPVSSPIVEPLRKVEQPTRNEITTAETATHDNEIKPLKAAVHETRSRSAPAASLKMRRMGNDVASGSSGRTRKAPSLSELNDDDDDTLRLSDMFDEIGG